MRISCFAAVLASTLVSASVQASGPCDGFARKLPNIKRSLCEAARLEASAARSGKGQPLWVRNIQPEDVRLRVLVIGGIHGDELSSAAVAPHWGRDAKVYWLDAEMRQMWLDLLRWMSERAGPALPGARVP